MNDRELMEMAIKLSADAVSHGNEPFGAVLAKTVKSFIPTKTRFTRSTTPLSTRKPACSAASLPKPASRTCPAIRCTAAASRASCAAARWSGQGSGALSTRLPTAISRKFSAAAAVTAAGSCLKILSAVRRQPRAYCGRKACRYCARTSKITQRAEKRRRIFPPPSASYAGIISTYHLQNT